jgi:hypothetical protein
MARSAVGERWSVASPVGLKLVAACLEGSAPMNPLRLASGVLVGFLGHEMHVVWPK